METNRESEQGQHYSDRELLVGALHAAVAAGTPEGVRVKIGDDGGTRDCPDCTVVFVYADNTSGYDKTAFDVTKAVDRLTQIPPDEPVKVLLRGDPDHDLLITGSFRGLRFCVFVTTAP